MFHHKALFPVDFSLAPISADSQPEEKTKAGETRVKNVGPSGRMGKAFCGRDV